MVQPIITPLEMARIDAAAPVTTSELVERAGAAVARTALELLGGRYGRRVGVIVGKGNNGADGRAAARRLERLGVGVHVQEAGSTSSIHDVDLVIDAAYGTGFRGTYDAPEVGDAPVLAVDIPSGVDGATGIASGSPLAAVRTVCLAALKPGLLFADGARLAGDVEVADIGLDVSGSSSGLVTDSDVRDDWPLRDRNDHKWRHATWIVAGSPGMTGAAVLACAGAARAGAGYVRLSIPGGGTDHRLSVEVVTHDLPSGGWNTSVLDSVSRFSSVVLGPGLGRDPASRAAVIGLASSCPAPLVIDGDALWSLASADPGVAAGRRVLLTPHDGEFAQLCGHPPGHDRIEAALTMASERGVTVLLKGPSTVVASPDGRAAVVTSGDSRLATAGTGDVLAGMIGALAAQGVDLALAAALAAHIHGRAAMSGPRIGLVAGDVADLVPIAVEAAFR